MAQDNQLTDLMVALQLGIPLERHPFAALGAQLGIAEEAIFSQILKWFDLGEARRFGGSFDAARLGYSTRLCAVSLPEADMMKASMAVLPRSGVTRCDMRGWPASMSHALAGVPESAPNLWFSLTAPASSLGAELAEIRAALAPHSVLTFATQRKFKNYAPLDPRPAPADAHPAPSTTEGVVEPSDTEKRIVTLFQGGFRPGMAFFEEAAAQLDMDPDALLDTLRRWHEHGLLERIALTMQEAKVGFPNEAMCVWQVPADRISAAGAAVAADSSVLHCCERLPQEGFSYNLFAHLRGPTCSDIHTSFLRISEAAAIAPGLLLASSMNYKDTVMKFF